MDTLAEMLARIDRDISKLETQNQLTLEELKGLRFCRSYLAKGTGRKPGSSTTSRDERAECAERVLRESKVPMTMAQIVDGIVARSFGPSQRLDGTARRNLYSAVHMEVTSRKEVFVKKGSLYSLRKWEPKVAPPEKIVPEVALEEVLNGVD